ncbi:unnamed protein product [Pedinophyceae sp. YPF-701]|nr:unnamed protein product [Pedinophyceae sp. YPF-701]
MQVCASGTHSDPVPHGVVLVKFGGSAITVKSTPDTLRQEALDSAADLVAKAYRAHAAGAGPMPLVVHGAGSFGHQLASQYGVAKGGLHTEPRVKEGLARTRVSVAKLNVIVTSHLVERGVPAVSLPPMGVWETASGALPASDADVAGIAQVARVARAGLVPVLYGDCILDADPAWGCSVLSGDTIITRLASGLPEVRWAAFLTDVDGVLDRPPNEEGASVVRRVVVQSDGSWSADGADIRMEAAAHDVSGGIAGKVAEAAAMARAGTPVMIARWGTEAAEVALMGGPDATEAAGDAWVGTAVLRSS